MKTHKNTEAREALAQLARRSAERAAERTNRATVGVPAPSPEPVCFGHELSTTQMLVAHFGGRKGVR